MFNNEEFNHIIDNINYLKTKFSWSIDPKIFEETISHLQQRNIPIEECVQQLCITLAEKAPDFVEWISWMKNIDWSPLSSEELSDIARGIVIVKHRKDIFQIFSSWWLFPTEYQFEFEKALHKAFPTLEIPLNKPIKITFHWLERERSSFDWIVNPQKIIRFDNTKFWSYEEAAKKIINLLNNESLIENNTKYMDILDINSIDITIDESPLNKNNPSFESRKLIVTTIHKLQELIDSQEASSQESVHFDTIYDTIQQIKKSQIFDTIQKEYIFNKIKWIMINKLVAYWSTLCTWYWLFKKENQMTIMLDEKNEEHTEDEEHDKIKPISQTGKVGKWLSQPILYEKYHTLYTLIQKIKNNKNTDMAYQYINILWDLLQNDTYHDCNYVDYQPWFIATTQKNAIKYCEILTMINQTKSLQQF